jgi:hypothetical protein
MGFSGPDSWEMPDFETLRGQVPECHVTVNVSSECVLLADWTFVHCVPLSAWGLEAEDKGSRVNVTGFPCGLRKSQHRTQVTGQGTGGGGESDLRH